MIGDDALKNLARRKVMTDPRRRRLVAATVAVPTALITTATTLVGLAIEPGNVAMPLWVLIPDSTSIIIWIFIFGFLFLISLAAFAVSDRETIEDLQLLQNNGASPDQLRRFMRFYSMIPGGRGVAIGAVTGMAIGFLIYLATGSGIVEPLQLLTVPVGAIVTAAVASAGVGLAARWPRHAVEQTSDRASTPQLVASPSQARSRSLRQGLVIAGCGLLMTVVGSATFNNWPGFRYTMFEHLGLYLLMFGPLALLTGVVMALPTVFGAIGGRLRSGPGWLRYAVNDFARNSGRSGKAAGAVLVLATLAVMAVAGLESDDGTNGDDNISLDSRYIVTRSARSVVLDDIQSILDDAPEVHKYATTRVATARLNLPGMTNDHYREVEAAVLDDVLIESLNLPPSDVDAADNNMVLINSNLAMYQRLGDNFDLRQIGHGEGALTPLAVLVGTDHPAGSGPPPMRYTVFITDNPMSDITRNRIADVGRQHQDWVEVQTAGFAPSTDLIIQIITAVAALMAIAAGLATSLLSARAEAPNLAIIGELGLGPRTMRLIQAAQAGFQQLLAGVVGSALGVVLFRLVTQGDNSVPGFIVPVLPVLAFVIAVPVATGLLSMALARTPDQTTGLADPAVALGGHFL